MLQFLFKKSTWSNLQLIPLKLCIASAYLIIGHFIPETVNTYFWPLVLLFGITLIVSLWIWLKQL
jgi:hypothetical protein